MYQLIEANFGLFNAKANGDSVAFAHVGGFIFGLLVARLLAHAGKSHPAIDCAPPRNPRGILSWRDGRSRLMDSALPEKQPA